MAYTKIKAIHVRLDRCVDYVVNPEKTASLSNALDYIEDRGKAEECLYVSAFNCGTQTAYADMMETKRRWNKASRKKEVLGYHLIQSFAPGEVTAEQAHEYGKELAARLLAGKYEAVVSTHLDREHLHNHIVFNSVSFLDGRMYRNSFKDYFGDIRGTSDAICRENDLSVIVPKDKGKPVLTVNKIDSITGDPLKGAQFEVWYASNPTFSGEINYLGKYYTDATGQFVLTGLSDGWYRAKEIAAPNGYAFDENNEQSVYIKAGTGKVLTFGDRRKFCVIDVPRQYENLRLSQE